MGEVRQDDPRTPYAYFERHFCSQVYHQLGSDKSMEETKMMAAERWKNMSDAEKKPYKDACASGRRKEEQRPEQKGEGKGLKRKRKRKAAKDPNAPKRATTAFFFFAQEERPKVRAANPDFKVTEISKELGKMWGQMSQQQKEKYDKMAVRDRVRYQEEMKVYTEANQNGNDGDGSVGSSDEESR